MSRSAELFLGEVIRLFVPNMLHGRQVPRYGGLGERDCLHGHESWQRPLEDKTAVWR